MLDSYSIFLPEDHSMVELNFGGVKRVEHDIFRVCDLVKKFLNSYLQAIEWGTQ